MDTITETLRPVIERCTHHYATVNGLGGLADIPFDVAFTVVPTPNGLQPVVATVMFVKSPLLGQWFAHTVFIADPHVQGEAQIDDLFHTAFDLLMDRRSKAIAGTNGHG